VSRQLGEDKDIEARKNNIILYRVPEHAFGTPAENSNRDISFFKAFCQEGIEIEMTDQDVAKTYRLGKKETDKTRPLLIKLKDMEKKLQVMKNLKKLKNAHECYKSISVAHDLTPLQRQHVKILLEQAKEQEASTSDGPSENERWIVVGQNGKPRMKKIKVRTGIDA